MNSPSDQSQRPNNDAAIRTRLAENLSLIQCEIDAACKRAGRDTTEVQLIAVTKYADNAWIKHLPEFGLTRFGESRVQQLVERTELFSSIQWHMIGQLQRNKVRALLPHQPTIHSVDSIRLARKISDVGDDLEITTPVLIEVNVSGEDSKSGFAIDQLKRDWQTLVDQPRLDIIGLMTMAPKTTEESVLRRCFGGLRQLRDELREASDATLDLPELSMGMSGDFPIAIEEGATMIRVGSRMFSGLADISTSSTN